ncbi:MAG: hypothetical protein ABMA15_22385 [Vicinamibacterales bacterium]
MALLFIYNVVSKRADYARTATGWRGEFCGPFTVRVEADDLESCRTKLLDAADAKIVQWLTGEWREPTASDSAKADAE